MKNLFLFSILLFLSLSAFSQQLPLRVVNNSSSSIPISLTFYGDAPLNPLSDECSECHTSFNTETFTILAGNSILLDEFTDFNGNGSNPSGLFPSDIIIFGGQSCSGGCNGSVAKVICANDGTDLPIWTQIDFTSPTGYGTKIGDPNALGGCQPSVFYSDSNSSFTASWQIMSNQILVLFED